MPVPIGKKKCPAEHNTLRGKRSANRAIAGFQQSNSPFQTGDSFLQREVFIWFLILFCSQEPRHQHLEKQGINGRIRITLQEIYRQEFNLM